MLVHWEVLFRHFIKSVSHAGQALGWHFDVFCKQHNGLEAFLWNFKTLNVNMLVRAFACLCPLRSDSLEFGFWIFCF